VTEQAPPASDAGQEAGGPGSAEQSSFPVRLAYAVYGAMSADLGCIIGALAFFLLIYLSFQFAPQLTPCTSAGGIPCAH
jgi:hypothetical protein